jgi:integrase/predicted RNA-binding Zn-ribbon protein involved in translation (DUF1610 family)
LTINELAGGEGASRECPNCHSKRIWRDGIRETRNVSVQRFLCRDCYYRFSESPSLSADSFNIAARQVCVTLRGAKNLDTATEIKTVAGDLQKEDAKGKIIEYLWHLNKEGRKPLTMQGRRKVLTRLLKHGADLLNPESVKETIARENVCINTKSNYVACYDGFAKWLKIQWQPPHYKLERRLPWLPIEGELDQLIAGCKKRTTVFLQTPEETMARCGEVWQLKWTDLNGNILTINNPEKGSNPRQFKISDKLVSMLNSLPKRDLRIFGPTTSIDNFRTNFVRRRKRLAKTLENPRLNKITFHTFRHWGATMLFAKTKNILYVKQQLGHRYIENTMVYTQLINFESDEYHVAYAKTLEEEGKLIESGFEYVRYAEGDAVAIYRKRK